VLNINESGARVNCSASEHVIIPIKVKEIYIASLKNRKLVTIIKTIYANGREPLPPFVIAPSKRIIDS
jgi:hypothetical protein